MGHVTMCESGWLDDADFGVNSVGNNPVVAAVSENDSKLHMLEWTLLDRNIRNPNSKNENKSS